MRRTLLTVAVVALVARPVSASPVVFGVSWDGTPPGDISLLLGVSPWDSPLPPFPAGDYAAVWAGSFAAWEAFDHLYADGHELTEGVPLTFTALTPWVLSASTPSYAYADSTGPQWAFYQATPEILVFGLEDITLAFSDHDYQDAYGAVRFLTPNGPPGRSAPEVPEANTLMLFGSGLATGAYMLRRRL